MKIFKNDCLFDSEVDKRIALLGKNDFEMISCLFIKHSKQ